MTASATHSAYAALVLRLSLATMWIAHASLKYFVFTMPGFAAWLTSNSLSAFLAWPIVLFEFIGGTAILAGVYGRWASLALLPILLGAIWIHAPNGWPHTSPGGGWEYPAFLAAASVVHALIGDGGLVLRVPGQWAKSG